MTTTPQPLTLRNLRVIRTMSRETTCFNAKIYLGAVRIGTAENDGHGGQTSCWIDPGVDRTRADAAAAALIQERGRDLEKELLAKHPRSALTMAVDLLVYEHETEQAAVRIRRKEITNAREFAARGFPWMIRCETQGQIVWYGLKDDSPEQVATVQRACREKYGIVKRHEVKRTQAVLDQAVAS